MVALSTLNCPVCGAPMQDAPARCAYCGSLIVIRMDHPRLDPALLDRALVARQIETLRGRLRHDATDAEARYGLGVAYFSLGLLDEAAGELEQAAKLTPEHPEIHVQLAVVLAELDIIGRKGAREQVRRRLATARSLQPNHPEALLLEARLEAQDGDWREALSTLRPALGQDPEIDRRATDLLLGRATMLAARDRWLDAASLWREAASIDGETTRAMLIELLREQQDTLLGPPKWSWVARPSLTAGREWPKAAAQIALPGIAALVISLIFAQWEATYALSLLFCAITFVLPAWLFRSVRQRRRAAAAPNIAVAETIRRDPAAFFRGAPSLEMVLAAADYVATELQGKAIVAENAWIAGGKRQAMRGASLRAPWMPTGERRD
jgi:hypothetical protein